MKWTLFDGDGKVINIVDTASIDVPPDTPVGLSARPATAEDEIGKIPPVQHPEEPEEGQTD